MDMAYIAFHTQLTVSFEIQILDWSIKFWYRSNTKNAILPSKKGECANNSMLANSAQFLTLSGTDKTGLISAALTYATGGKRLHNLCVIDFNPETQGPLWVASI